MMAQLFLRVLVTAAVGSAVLAVLLFPARGWLERRYAPQVRWTLWLGLAAMLVVGLFGQAPRPVLVVEAPRKMVAAPAAEPAGPAPTAGAAAPSAAVGHPPAANPPAPDGREPADSAGPVTQPPAPAERATPAGWRALPPAAALGWVWLGVAGLLMAGQLVRYGVIRRRLMRASAPGGAEFEAAGRAALRVLPGLSSPMALGYVRPVVFLPQGAVHPMAVRHELTHIQRRDIWGKTGLFAVCALYWFDPLVWLMARVADRDMEAACDAQVVKDLSPAEKRGYGELLLRAAGQKRAPLATHFGGGGREMKQRLSQLFRPGKTSRALVCLVVAAALAASSLVACEGREGDALADGTYYATLVLAKQGEESDFAKVAFELVDYVPGANWVGESYESRTLPVAPAVRLKKEGEETALGEGQKNWKQKMFDFLAWPNLRAQFIHGADVLRLEVAGGTVTAMEWVSGAEEKPGMLWTDADYGQVVPCVLSLPGSWRDKFYTTATCTRDGEGAVRHYRVEFFQRDHGQADGLLFVLQGVAEEQFEGRADWEIEAGHQPVVVLGRGGGLVFCAYGELSDAHHDTGAQGEAYKAMAADLKAALSQESFLYTGRPAGAAGGADSPAQPQLPPQVDVDWAARAAFAQVLRNVLEENVLPDGSGVPQASLQGEAEENRFAVADVDGDGKEELVLCMTAGITAGHRGYILGYDSAGGEVYTQLEGYPAFGFYSNGAVKELWSHNQGWGEMWPYFLHVYHRETDGYRWTAGVDSWSRALMEENGIEGYPGEVDVSGAGTVYFVEGDGHDGSKPMDEADYTAWLAPYLGDARPVEVAFSALNRDNLAALTDRAGAAGEGTPDPEGPAEPGELFQRELEVRVDTGETLRLAADCRREDESWYGVSTLRVYAGDQLLQTLPVADAIRAAEQEEGIAPSGTAWSQAPESEYLPVLMDLNFDGVPDIRLVELVGNVNYRWLCWLWNGESGRYEYAFCLVGHTLELREQDETFTVQARLSANEQETCCYGYGQDGTLTQLWRVIDRAEEPGSGYWLQSEDQGGRLVNWLHWNNYEEGKRFVQLTDIEPHTPLDQLPAELLARLEPEAEPWTQESVGVWRNYKAPDLELLVSSVEDETLREWAETEEEYAAERGREYVCSIVVTGGEYTTGAGLRVGDTLEDCAGKGYVLQEGENRSMVGLESINITVENGRITRMQYSDGGRWVGKYFW